MAIRSKAFALDISNNCDIITSHPNFLATNLMRVQGSLYATASMISRSEIPSVTTTEAPTNMPEESLATAEADALLVLMTCPWRSCLFHKF